MYMEYVLQEVCQEGPDVTPVDAVKIVSGATVMEYVR